MWGRCKKCERFSFSLDEDRFCYKCDMKRMEDERIAAMLSRRDERRHRDKHDVWVSKDSWHTEDDSFNTAAAVIVASSLLSGQESSHPVAEPDLKSEIFQGGESGGGGASASFDDSSGSSSSYDSGCSSCDSGGSCGCD